MGNSNNPKSESESEIMGDLFLTNESGYTRRHLIDEILFHENDIELVGKNHREIVKFEQLTSISEEIQVIQIKYKATGYDALLQIEYLI